MKSSFIIALCIVLFGLNQAQSQTKSQTKQKLSPQAEANKQVRMPVVASKPQQETINAIFQLVYGASTGHNEEPVEIASDIYSYYVFNKKGVILQAAGSTQDRALYDIAGGIKEGRIIVGSYTLSRNNLKVKWNKSGNSVSWEYDSPMQTIYLSDKLKLSFVQTLD